MKKSALVVIDMQKFFFSENPQVDEQALAKNCSEIIDIARQAEIPVIHVMTLYREDRVDWPRAWRHDGQSWCSNLVREEDSAQVVDNLVVKPHDLVVEKRRFSGFYNTNLDDVLRSTGCDHLYVVGYSADVCLRYTSVDAYNRGYGVTLVYEGIESFRETKDESVAYLGWLIDASCLTMAEFKKELIGSTVH
ncbi:isochorismatase family cysteine hydrolase [Amycolatopsis sp.]|uniref:cysteine hydrolase family protein n=1 Tax=Amycolatopsis sp. TaxID=37632 RepID=UPI002D808C28|nr:isochorismatase family cysteine hydrolase [Amycolatopsis sp.]HET6711172.1 isochorismatase family cysteine hydrolase [Amycolatopsis sp.]